MNGYTKLFKKKIRSVKMNKAPKDNTMEILLMIKSIAWSFHNSTGIPVDELISEGNLAYLEALPKYDPNKGMKQTSFVYLLVKNHLLNYLKKNSRNRTCPTDPMILDEVVSEETLDGIEFRKDIETKSEELAFVAGLIFKSPGEYLGAGGKGRLKDDLRKSGWRFESIWKTFAEMKSFLRESI